VTSISRSGVSRRIPTIGAGILAIVLAALLWMASSAQAAELVYWNNYKENTIAFASIDGTGGGPLNLTGSVIENPEGMAIDTATNRLFVANAGDSSKKTFGHITAINLDGSGAATFSPPGAPVDVPEGVVIDPATRMIFWANTGTEPSEGSIAWANLDGSAGGTLNTTGAKVESPYRMGLDPVAGRIYWTNTVGPLDSIAYANANNTGGGTLNLSGATVPKGISGYSVDPAGGRLYWIENENEIISFAGLSGGSGGDLSTTGATVNDPYGLAFDPTIGKFYFGNYGNSATRIGAIGTLNLAGGGGAINIATAPVEGPQDPMILKSPSGAGAAKITRSKKSRSKLVCSTGSWAADFAGSFVYQAPHAFAYQWKSKGKSLEGATKATLQAKSAGKYTCVVTASNQAGSASQTSKSVNVKAAKVKLTAKKKVSASPGGVAKFKVTGANQGDLKSGNARVCVKVAKQDKSALKAPKCKSLGQLKGRGKRTATLKVEVGQSAGGAYPVTFLVRGSAGTSAKAKILVK
jgi:DNA-binding beta-propeller fold protein YncE